MDLMNKATEMIATLFVVMLMLSILIIPNLDNWGSSLSSVSGYDLSGLPIALFVALIITVLVGFYNYLSHGKKR